MHRTSISLAVVLTLAIRVGAEAPSAKTKAAMNELWRRGNCLLSSVLKPAAKEASMPRDLRDTPVLRPRLRSADGRLLCYATDGATLWAADDQALYQVDARGGKLVKRYDLADGLPDSAIQSIAPSGDTVWLATRRGLARLDVSTGRCTSVEGIRFGMARLTTGAGAVWLVSDSGAYRLAAGRNDWQKLPSCAALKILAGVSGRGFWWAKWRDRVASRIPQVFTTADGLYAICIDRLVHYPDAGGACREISNQTWHAVARGRTVWALTTGGLLRYDAATGKTERFATGDVLPAGRPTALAVGNAAVFVATEADYDQKSKSFAGGGIGRLDLKTGKWTVRQTVGQTNVRFVTALLADGDEAWAACTLYDRVVQLGAHPGMAHVKRFRPHVSGLALLHFDGKDWGVVSLKDQKPDRRWVLGQKGTFEADAVVPKRFDRLWRSGENLWGVFRMVPERFYSGYYISAGSLAARANGVWQGQFDIRTKELGLAGEQPELMLVSHSHGERLVLAEGHPRVLAMEPLAGRTWAVCENGLFVHDSSTGKFAPVVRAARRAYWRVTAAAAGTHAVWFGGDGGTISRLDRKTGRIELVGVAGGRKIVSLAVLGDLGVDDEVAARSEATKAVLPASLADVAKLPATQGIAYSGKAWYPRNDSTTAPKPRYRFKKRSNYLYRGTRRVGFIPGVFRPTVLCEDKRTGTLWLGTYSGVAGVALPQAGGE